MIPAFVPLALHLPYTNARVTIVKPFTKESHGQGSAEKTRCGAKGEQHTREQRLLPARLGFPLADPIRGSINGVLSEKQVQLGRMFLHVAHVVQL
jgi:hypothetical protein